MGNCGSKKHSKLPPTPKPNPQPIQSDFTSHKTSNSSPEMSPEAQEFKTFVEEIRSTGDYPSPNAEQIKTKSSSSTKPSPQSVQKVKIDAQPIEEKEERVVNAVDGRKQIFATSKYPYSVHGLFVFKFNQINNWGTGTMIGPNIVLTAGHNLYSHKEDAFADIKSMQFMPGMNGQALPFGSVEVDQYFISPNYLQNKTEDYGILILKEPIGEVTGYFGLSCLNPEEIKRRTINVTGYPADKVASKQNTFEMWGMEGEASRIDQKRGLIEYRIDTEAGQSGGGVWYQDGEGYYVCGVHVSGTQFVNQATLLTRDMYRQIHTWLQKVESLKFGEAKELKINLSDLDIKGLTFLVKSELQCSNVLYLSGDKFEPEKIRILAQDNSGTNLLRIYSSRSLINAEGAKALSQNTSWTNLLWLNLSHNNIGAEGAKALSQNTSWSSLSVLQLNGNDLRAEGVKALASSSRWAKLSKLDLSNNSITSEGAQELARNTSWINLATLKLNGNNIGPEGAKALAENPSWKCLSFLDLSVNNIGPEGARALSQNISWSNLSGLQLNGNDIRAEGVKALAQNTSWTKLSKLDLSNNNITTKGAQELAQNTSWKNLSQLYLGWNRINAEGARAIAQNTCWVNIKELDLQKNDLRSKGARALAENLSWINLTVLNLNWNKIDAKGAEALAQNTSWVNLSDLHLSFNQIGTEGARGLARNTSWIKLSSLSCSWSEIDSEGFNALWQWKPSLEIRTGI